MRGVLAAVAVIMLAGCVSAPPCRNHTQLFLGGAIGEEGARVDDAAWQAFVEGVILPRFPDGFTVMEAQGVWRSPQTARAIAEPTRMLVVLHEDSAVSNRRLDEIAAEYKARFRQESVLRLDKCGAYKF